MVIVKLKGGLGNQMFQYAAAKKAAVEHDMPLKLDLSFFEAEAIHHTKRDFELHKLNITAETATEEEIRTIRRKRWKNSFYPVWIKDRGVAHFSKKLIRCKEYVYLDGYWQSEEYFKSISPVIRKEFTFRQPLDKNCFLNIEHQINHSNSVSVHFRRGDYINDPKTHKHHGVCSISYYQEAMRKITEKTNNPVFFIFSDDIQWVKAHFKSSFPMFFIEQSDENLHTDFRLMSFCKHNIIANSTYSWWAAWLNENEKKIIVAPEKWYSNKHLQSQTSHLLPTEWITL